MLYFVAYPRIYIHILYITCVYVKSCQINFYRLYKLNFQLSNINNNNM